MKPLILFSVLFLIGSTHISAKDEVAALFPRIGVELPPAHLIWIADYGKTERWNPLSKNSVRLVVQPSGYISAACEIGLETGKVVVYPGTHSKESALTLMLPPEARDNLRLLVTSDEFLQLPSRNDKIGRDGTTYFIEVDIEGAYRWILHWQPDDIIIQRIFEAVSYENNISNKE